MCLVHSVSKVLRVSSSEAGLEKLRETKNASTAKSSNEKESFCFIIPPFHAEPSTSTFPPQRKSQREADRDSASQPARPWTQAQKSNLRSRGNTSQKSTV